VRRLHTKATPRRNCSMTGEKAAATLHGLRKPSSPFLESSRANCAAWTRGGGLLQFEDARFHCALLAYPCSAAARQRSIDSRLNRQSLPTLKAGICPLFSMR
jgi:hypothetical protein